MMNGQKPTIFARAILGLILAVMTSDGWSAPSAQGPQRQKVIDFDDEIVEGMNKRPLDSLSQISEKNKRRRKAHLYRKRASFRTETLETLRELRYLP